MLMRDAVHARREDRFHVACGVLFAGGDREWPNDGDALAGQWTPTFFGNGVEPEPPEGLSNYAVRSLGAFRCGARRVVVEMPEYTFVRNDAEVLARCEVAPHFAGPLADWRITATRSLSDQGRDPGQNHDRPSGQSQGVARARR